MSTTLTPSRTLTKQQRQALDARDHSVSLAAGAGCGKTFVLTERFIGHVDPTQAEPGDLEELVAITFTDAAAREMRDRIRRRCFERLQSAATPAEAAAWQRLMRSMDAARISTIHAFCTQLLRTYAVEAGLDPMFEVLDAAAAELLKLETVDDRLRALLAAGDEDVLELAARRGIERLRGDLAALAGPRAETVIELWHDATPEELVARWQQFHANDVVPRVFEELQRDPALTQLRGLCDPTAAKSAHLAQRLRDLAAAIDCLATTDAANCSEQLAAIVSQARVTDIRGAKHWDSVEDYEPFKQACERVRALLKGCSLTQPADFSSAADAAALGLAMLRLVADVNATLDAIKLSRNQLEFDDLLARAERLLTDPAHEAVQRRVSSTARLLMVDEFQDTNQQQVNIVKAFCGPDWKQRGLFTVGDFKQSIYRFNGAEPQISLDLRHETNEPGRLSLTRNFRSQPAITDFVNAIFHDEFSEYEPLAAERRQATPTPAIDFLWTPADVDDADDSQTESDSAAKKRRRAGATRDARALEARWIARRLVQLLKSPEPIVVDADGTARPLQLGDIAILLRTLSDAQVYEEALRDHGLSYYLAGGHAFYSQQEVYDVLNLLRAVASHVDEIALAGALRSPLFSLADETLFWLVERHKTLNAALAASAPPPNLIAEEAAKVRRAANILARLRTDKDRLLASDLLSLAVELTGYDAVLLTEFLGPRKAANIEKLIEQARALDRSAPGDLHGFITQLSEFVVRAPKEALAATQSEGDVIRIMTIHYAKGLEFPLVVLPDLDRQRNAGFWQPVLDERLGPLMPLDGEENHGCTGLDLYRHIENLEDLEERKRLFYVGCTRAADYLILSSSIEDPAKPKRDWLQLVARHVSLVDGSLAAPLPAGYAAPQLRVITSMPLIDDDAPVVPRGPDLHRLVVKSRELAARSPGELPVESDPISPHLYARRRFSFSQLTGQLAPEEQVQSLDEPTFESAAGIGHVDGRALGALVHAILERIDFRQPESLHELCRFLAPRFSPADSEVLATRATELVHRFLESPRLQQLRAAQAVRREVEFLLPWRSADSAAHGRYLHGFIDCLFQDPQGRWRLLDYKTNRSAGRSAEIVNRYELQMLVYSLACERILGEPLAECSLLILDGGQEHSYTWDDRRRSHGIERITAAMNSLAKD